MTQKFAIVYDNNFNKMTYGNRRGKLYFGDRKLRRLCQKRNERVVGIKHPIEYIDYNRF